MCREMVTRLFIVTLMIKFDKVAKVNLQITLKEYSIMRSMSSVCVSRNDEGKIPMRKPEVLRRYR